MSYPLTTPISWKFTGKPWDLNSLPLTPDEVWAKLDLGAEEVRLELDALIAKLNSTGVDNWLYQQIVSAVLSGVADNSLTDVKLSDAVGQIKDRFTTHIAEKITDTMLSDVAGQIKERTATHIADVVKHITSEERTAWNAKLDAVQMVMSHGSSVQTATFPIRTGAGPYVYTVVTVTIPIASTVEEIELKVGSGHVKLFRGLDFALVFGAGSTVKPIIKAINLTYGGTLATLTSLTEVGTIFTSSQLYMIDSYISGSSVILKIASNTAPLLTGVSETFEYIARG